MYTGFGLFPVLLSRLLDGRHRGKVAGNQYLRSTFIFVMRCSRHSYVYTFLVNSTALYPLPYIHLIPPLCRALMRGYFAHDVEKEMRTKKARSRWQKEREREIQMKRSECTSKMCNKQIAGQRSRIGPGLFEDDLKISLYEA